MNYFELQQEIHSLQAQLDSIQRDEREEVKSDLQSLLGSATPKELLARLKSQIRQGGQHLEENQQLQELVVELEQQIEQLPSKACILIFSAGVVFGRVLS